MVKTIIQPNLLQQVFGDENLHKGKFKDFLSAVQGKFPEEIFGTPIDNNGKAATTPIDLYIWLVSQLEEMEEIQEEAPIRTYSKILSTNKDGNDLVIIYEVVPVTYGRQYALFNRGNLRYNGALICQYEQSHTEADIQRTLDILSRNYTINDYPMESVDEVAEFIHEYFNQQKDTTYFRNRLINYVAPNFGYDRSDWENDPSTQFYKDALNWAKYTAFKYADYVFKIKAMNPEYKYKHLSTWQAENESDIIAELKNKTLFSQEITDKLLNVFGHTAAKEVVTKEPAKEKKPRQTRTKK